MLRSPALRLLLMAGLWLPFRAAADTPLRPVDPRCESQTDPIGIDEPRPEFSWRLESPRRGDRQAAWQILVASDLTRLSQDQGDLWDSGRVNSDETLHHPYSGRPLKSSTQVFWKVRVWDPAGEASAWSPVAHWGTGLLLPAEHRGTGPSSSPPAGYKGTGPFSSPDWKARWVTAPYTNGLPMLRREFQVNQPVRQAFVHVSGLGHYELFLDGAKVGDRFLDPAWTVYERTVNYASFDVTTALARPGPHVFGMMLGKGFYRTRGDRRVHGVQSDRPLKAILQAHLILADGSEQWITTDRSWTFIEGPITHSAILAGEDHDARRMPEGWSKPGFDASAWNPVTECDGPGGTLQAAISPPMIPKQTFRTVRIDEPEPGRFVYDFGQNASAIPRLRVRGRAGQVVRLTPAEQRHGMTPRKNDGRGLVNPAGVGTPSYFEYTLRGGTEETWEPQFTYTGFQYLQVDGAVPAGQPNPQGKPEIVDLVSVHIRSAAKAVGEFQCSDPLFNDIDRLVDWAVRANLAHVLTDCPHREKLGWLEVAYLMGPSMAGRYDLSRFFAKIARDCAESQATDGRVPTVAPAYPAFSGGFAYTPEWGAAAVVIPWLAYEWYGDRRTLERALPTMRRFVDYMRSTSNDLLPVAGLGDWYDYGHGKPVGASQFTPPVLSAMATFHRCARIVANAARVLGQDDAAREYGELAERIARRFQEHWFDGRDAYRNQGSPQTANAMALTCGIVPPDNEPRVLEAIVHDLRKRAWQQTAGDIGHWYLLQALATHERSDVIHDMTARTSLGSYGLIVRNGWTSMPEAWDADTGASMNHCMLGHIQEWFMGWVAGIRPDPRGPGFQRILITPQPVGNLSWARAAYESARGTVRVHWNKSQDAFELALEIPVGTRATVEIPATEADRILESGVAVNAANSVRALERKTHLAVFEVEGGSYRFEVKRP